MKLTDLTKNLENTLTVMKTVTGKIPGTPTGLCHAVVLGALTGNKVLYITHTTPMQQMEAEKSAGLIRLPVERRQGISTFQLVLDLLTQQKLSLDAVVAVGTVTKQSDTPHIIAVVPDCAKAPYGIVDSLAPGALTVCKSLTKVRVYLRRRFPRNNLSLYLVPTLHELKQRTRTQHELLYFTDYLRVLVPKKKSSPAPGNVIVEFFNRAKQTTRERAKS